MKKKFLALSVFSILLFGGINFVKAETLPASDDPFWTIMADLSRPDDASCQAKTEALLTSLGLPGGTERAAATCAGVAGIMQMQTDMESSGVTTNLFSQEDWHHVNGLYFEKTGYGKIEFSSEIDFMSYDFMVFIQTFGERMDMQQDEISLDADIVESLRTAGAILTMYNVSNFVNPEILVDDGTDTGGVVSGLTYNADTDTITFNAAHFTSFKAVEKGSSKKTKKPTISKVEYRKYTDSDGKEKVKVEIRGKYFNKKASIKLGHQTVTKIEWKNSQKIEAAFTLKKVLKGKYKNPATLKVTNPSGKSKKFHEKLDLNQLTKELS